MGDNPRDTQFKGFAKLLMDELFYNNERVYTDLSNGYWCGESREIIARRAYDLVKHAVSCGCTDHANWVMLHALDMTELPKETN